MNNLSAEQLKRISNALAQFNTAAQELAASLEESGYELDSAPECLEDPSDFAYDIMTMVEEELEALDDISVTTEEHKELVTV